jgi:hypothetical protein
LLYAGLINGTRGRSPVPPVTSPTKRRETELMETPLATDGRGLQHGLYAKSERALKPRNQDVRRIMNHMVRIAAWLSGIDRAAHRAWAAGLRNRWDFSVTKSAVCRPRVLPCAAPLKPDASRLIRTAFTGTAQFEPKSSARFELRA